MNFIKEFIKFEPVLFVVSILAILGVAFIIIDGVASQPETVHGKVIDKHYSAASNRTGTGVGMTSGGQTAVVITSETEPEKFILIVKSEQGQVVTAKCEPELYYEKEIGHPIEVAVYKGRFTGMAWTIKGVR